MLYRSQYINIVCSREPNAGLPPDHASVGCANAGELRSQQVGQQRSLQGLRQRRSSEPCYTLVNLNGYSSLF